MQLPMNLPPATSMAKWWEPGVGQRIWSSKSLR